MACSVRSLLAFLLLSAACRGDEPGVGSGSSDPDSGSGSESGTEGVTSEASETLEPDSSGGSTTGDEGFARICDGSDELRLALGLGGGGLTPDAVMVEIGFAYVYVLGTCEYFALPLQADGAGGQWPDARTGVLDPATEEALSRAIDYGHLADYAGSWSDPEAIDESTLFVSDGVSTVTCYGGCNDGPEGAGVLWNGLAFTDSLWLEGERYEGPVRISVVGWADATLDELGAPWPLPIDPWSIASDGNVDPPPQEGESVLIDDPAQVDILREQRRQYREDDLPDGAINALQAYGHLTYADEGSQDLFQLWMRDSLPIEDENGLIPLPSP